MRLRLLPLLACPACGGELEFARLESLPREDEDIAGGELRCRTCGKDFPIVDSIPRLLPGAVRDRKVAKTRSGFGMEWLRYPGPRAEDRDLFLEETQLSPDACQGRLVLDGGCGMGRYARVALSLGAEVVAFDLSESLLRLLDEARGNPRLHLVQGDLLAPPFRKGTFDVIYSQGVLHHTAAPRRAFGLLAGLVKRGGLITAWVYGTPGSFSSFSTNPLRPGREGVRRHLRLAWLVVWTRQVLSDLLRVVTTRLPQGLLYALCHPLALLGAVPVAKYLTFSVEKAYRVRLAENFDWLAPPFQSKHTKEEVRGWLEESGCEPLKQLAHGLVPKVGFLSRKK
jgi:uncharacterized protein YbaR (Trm112 family)/ubiquinone/menaquinone biosynthesis C-methylase UbiE